MKKGLKIMGVCLIIILNAVCFCSCLLIKDKTFVYDDYFVCYADYGQPGQTAILELTDLGKEQEVLIIPETINGQKVVSLGGYVPGLFIADKRWFFSENLKKVYIPFLVDVIFSQSKDKVSLHNSTIVYSAIECNEILFCFYFDKCKEQVLPFKPEFNDVEQRESFENYKIANCFFYKNSNVMWVDYIADGEVYALPAYLQIDWYLEPDCINLWNGEYVIPDGQEQLNLYSK